MHAITIVLLFRTRLLRFKQLYKEMPCAVRSNLGGPSELASGVARQPHATEEEASLRSGKKPSAFRELEAVVNLRLAWRRGGGGRRRGLNPWPEEGGSCQGRPRNKHTLFLGGESAAGRENAEKVQKPEVGHETAEGYPEQMLICFSIPFFSLQEMSRFAEKLLA